MRAALLAPRFWLGMVVAITGILTGLGSFTFIYGEGYSYLSNDPETCINCHIMRDQYEGWNHSSHKDFATCNDCHIPHEFPDKYIVKGINGWNHSFAFTTGNFDEPIRIREFNADVVQENCMNCHGLLVSQVQNDQIHAEEMQCIECHRNVGHNR